MSTIYLSSVFPLVYSDLNTASFRLSPEVDRKIGNSFAWHFSKQFTGIVVIWEKGYFWILAKPNVTLPNLDSWKQALEDIQEKQKDKLGNRNYVIQWNDKPQITASIIANFAVRVLTIHGQFKDNIVFSRNQVKVQRRCDFWSEKCEINNQIKAAITFNPKSDFLYQETLAHFFENHPDRNDPEKILIDLLVRDIDSNSTARIVGINGTIGDHKDRLLKQATGSTSKKQLKEAPNDQPVVSVQFGKNSDIYDYAMAALRPCVTSKTAAKLDLEYGALLKWTKISYQERKELLFQYKQDAEQTLSDYGIKFAQRCLNSGEYPNLFWTPDTQPEDTLLLFGNKVTFPRNQTLRGLSKGGVYRRHQEFQDPARKIRLGILNFSSMKVKAFCDQLNEQLTKYKFNLLFENNTEFVRTVSLEQLSETEAKAKVQTLVDEIIQVPKDIVLVFLPESDRGKDDSDGNSIYAWVYSCLLRRKVASQVIYENTLKQNYKYILNQVVIGILAKLGNLPFVLAEPLSIADYCIGLDISRRPKKNGNGSINACTSIRLYNQQGQFIRYQIANNFITEGEEIPAKTLQEFFPKKEFTNKRVLIYRDGRFCGEEVNNLVEWSQAINAEFILVECAKSKIPRLYNLSDKNLQQPTRGLALKLSSREMILVTTKIEEKRGERIGVPRPLRLKVREEGLPIDLEKLATITLKLTLLHHGSLKDPRLPIPLFGADRIAYRQLQGIYPGDLEGDKQYWL